MQPHLYPKHTGPTWPFMVASDKPGHTPSRKSFEAPGADHDYRKRERGEPRTLPTPEMRQPTRRR
jgi:hypothetical protein